MASTTAPNGLHTAILSPLDQYMPRIYVRIYLVFHTPDPLAAVESLNAGVKELGSRLPFLQGSVNDNHPHGQIAISWSASDAPLSLHPISCCPGTNTPSFKQLEEEGALLHYFADAFPALIQARTAANPQNPGSPAFAAGYTILDAAVVVGVAVHHSIADGTGVSEIIRFWASCTRQSSPPENQTPRSDEPLLRRALLRSGLPPPSEKPLTERLASLPQVYLRSLDPSRNQAVDTSATKGGIHLFTFSVSRLESARVALRSAEAELDPAALSTNNILTGIIWACVSRARAARRKGVVLGNGMSKMGFAINGRRQFTGDIAARPYVGNVNLYGLPELPCGVLEGIGAVCLAGTGQVGGLLPVLKGIYEAIKRVTGGHIAEFAEMMEAVGDVRDVTPNWVRANGPDLSVTSWANMGVYESDFGEGVGKPLWMRVPGDFVGDGLVIVLPRKRTGEDVRGIEVLLLMCEEDLRFLEGDEVWRSWLV
ncbi:transferase family-domain-containing protein [Cercophora newfieldiana]|uniref:Transferase family-domain-containing protein n=1 Tax=Cercophora newfieldiana TaxID=92897 RepID=A0AA39YGR6_9PEZI|nr:transferase family-domain-containing protein [Cercophora newfieldiana]